MTTDDLETQVRWLVDVEQIKQLKHRYCAHCDDDYDAEELAPLFTEDAIWDGGRLGYAEGREAIREFFLHAPNLVKWAIHHVTNPVIEVAGDRATGSWYLWQPMVTQGGDQAMWLAARYTDRYRRVDGDWLFEHVKVDVRFFSPYEEGYGRVPMAEVPS
jgi:nuclear transport factor 2 (NTF2) superfamily protein